MENIDVDFSNLTRNQVINKYIENLRQLKSIAEQHCNIRAFQFDSYVLFQYFEQNRSASNNNINSSNHSNNHVAFIKAEILKQIIDRKRKILFWIFYLFIACIFISYKNEASTIVLRNIQTFIYPGMKVWRKVTLPVIKKFPGLTELYDESCLMMNPFFQVDDLNCDPCANVKNVLDLTNMDETTEFVPFVFKIQQDFVQPEDIFKLYTINRDTFQRDAFRVQSTNREITNLDELFNDFNRTHHEQSHNLWRCNRMQPARLIRRLFTRPERLPKTGIALERYVMIDTPNAASYTLPDTECSNMYVQQALGTRFIILRPTPECRHKCRTLSVRLPQSFVLSYNWWYWKPISAPVPLTETVSISLIGSYC